ncbi:MAG: hypothetical protein M3358_08355, partial [Actinomycetota bacterium]|nr:hypothetical protein [Actinomycetota bacterium]
VDAELEEAFPERALAWVEIETMDGSRARSGVLGAWGDAGTRFGDRELTKKVRSLTDPLLGSGHAKKLLSAVHRLPESPDLGEVTSLLRLAQSRTCEGYNRAEF